MLDPRLGLCHLILKMLSKNEWVVRAEAKAKAGVRFPTIGHALSELPTWGTLSHRGI